MTRRRLRIDGEDRPAGPVGDVQQGAVAAEQHVVGPDAARGDLRRLVVVEPGRGEGGLVDVQRIERPALGVEEDAAAEGEALGRLSSLGLAACRLSARRVRRVLGLDRRRLCGAGAGQFQVFQVVGVQHGRTAAGPPDAVLFGADGQAEPALAHGLLIHHLERFEIDNGQRVLVESARGDEGVFAVGQRDDVERQIGQRDLLAGRRDGPAVGQEKAFVAGAGAGGSVGGGACGQQRGRQADGQEGATDHDGVFP